MRKSWVHGLDPLGHASCLLLLENSLLYSNHLQGWVAAAEVAVVEVRYPVILACRHAWGLILPLHAVHYHSLNLTRTVI